MSVNVSVQEVCIDCHIFASVLFTGGNVEMVKVESVVVGVSVADVGNDDIAFHVVRIVARKGGFETGVKFVVRMLGVKVQLVEAGIGNQDINVHHRVYAVKFCQTGYGKLSVRVVESYDTFHRVVVENHVSFDFLIAVAFEIQMADVAFHFSPQLLPVGRTFQLNVKGGFSQEVVGCDFVQVQAV